MLDYLGERRVEVGEVGWKTPARERRSSEEVASGRGWR